MYNYPTLFPEISNRESWIQTIQLFDDDTGDLISLIDGSGNSSYAVTLEIRPKRQHGAYGYSGSPYYDDCTGEPIIYSQLAQGAPANNPGGYIAVVDTGTISIQIPKSVMQTLRGVTRTFDVFLTLDDSANDDGRQILIGTIPVAYGGQNT